MTRESPSASLEDPGLVISVRVDDADSSPGQVEGVLKLPSGGVFAVVALGVHDGGSGSEAVAPRGIHAGKGSPGVPELAVEVMP